MSTAHFEQASSATAPLATFLDRPTRHLFFTGKGGVGKTALACATAIHLAEAGKRILLVSTDPASNLDEMLGVTLSNRPTPVPGVDHLWALDIDPEKAADDYRERVIAPYRDVWTESQIAELREQLAGSCTVEIAAFDEFAELLAGGAASVPFEHVLFDTAPTGHTLRLLGLPRAWTRFLQSTPQGASCLGPHSGLKMQETRFAAAVEALADGTRTTIVLVTRPDRAALREVDRTSGELDAMGIRNQQLAINAVFQASAPGDLVAAALEERGRSALRALPARLQGLPTLRIPLRAFNMVGLPALRAFLDDHAAAALARPASLLEMPVLPPLASLIDAIAEPGRGLVMVMGKGGVGKTTIAAAIAAELASRGYPVHLSTTDPAAHISTTLDGQLENLTVSRIDPVAETTAYVDRVMATRGAKLDEAGRALLAEDLRSPCYEEVAVFTAFARIVAEARSSFVILDTAPTGHTLLLLDTTGSYHRQVAATHPAAGQSSSRFVTPLTKLRDPEYTKVVLVTLAETTPVSEAAQLQADLRRAQIEPFGWVINSSLAAAGSADPCLQQRIAAELAQIQLVRSRHSTRVAIVPWVTEEPVGPVRLLALAQGRAAAADRI
jgi:arsenite/tail-anchored protein-transporting ATPase